MYTQNRNEINEILQSLFKNACVKNGFDLIGKNVRIDRINTGDPEKISSSIFCKIEAIHINYYVTDGVRLTTSVQSMLQWNSIHLMYVRNESSWYIVPDNNINHPKENNDHWNIKWKCDLVFKPKWYSSFLTLFK